MSDGVVGPSPPSTAPAGTDSAIIAASAITGISTSFFMEFLLQFGRRRCVDSDPWPYPRAPRAFDAQVWTARRQRTRHTSPCVYICQAV